VPVHASSAAWSASGTLAGRREWSGCIDDRHGYDAGMRTGRLRLLALACLLVSTATSATPDRIVPLVQVTDADGMHGLIGKMVAVDGRRDELISILLDGVAGMPGCLSYVVSKDVSDANALWITEVWDSKASHAASLSLPSVKAAIAKGRPLIARFDSSVTTAPVGGHGLARR
jgi:quinol monooxygenase YgiN